MADDGTAPPGGISHPPIMVTLVVVPRFPFHALALCVDALRIANREALGTVFNWIIAGEDDEAVCSSAGVAVSPNLAIEAVEFSPVTIVLAAYEPERACTERLLRWLKRQDRRGGSIGCVDTGALILARAGLTSRAETSVHQAALDGAREDYRVDAFTDHMFTFNARRFSSAGGIATFDMMLALIEHHQSKTLADRVARVMNHVRRDDARITRQEITSTPMNPMLARCIDLMLTHIEDPLPVSALSECVGVPEWTLRRLFKRNFATTPATYYRRLRLERARQLLAYSHLAVADVATACGFAEAASFSHAFRRCFGLAPSRCRADDAGVPTANDATGIRGKKDIRPGGKSGLGG